MFEFRSSPVLVRFCQVCISFHISHSSDTADSEFHWQEWILVTSDNTKKLSLAHRKTEPNTREGRPLPINIERIEPRN
jgi:hypothetical protein